MDGFNVAGWIFSLLQQAREQGLRQEAESALKMLGRRLKSEAKDIHDKYICPPYSTDFAVMYLPGEGLFTEALNIPGLAGGLQRSYRGCAANWNSWRPPWSAAPENWKKPGTAAMENLNEENGNGPTGAE